MGDQKTLQSTLEIFDYIVTYIPVENQGINFKLGQAMNVSLLSYLTYAYFQGNFTFPTLLFSYKPSTHAAPVGGAMISQPETRLNSSCEQDDLPALAVCTARWQKELDAAYICNVYHPTQTHTKDSNMQCLGLFMQGGVSNSFCHLTVQCHVNGVKAGKA